jgi:hypothetical protein
MGKLRRGSWPSKLINKIIYNLSTTLIHHVYDAAAGTDVKGKHYPPLPLSYPSHRGVLSESIELEGREDSPDSSLRKLAAAEAMLDMPR